MTAKQNAGPGGQHAAARGAGQPGQQAKPGPGRGRQRRAEHRSRHTVLRLGPATIRPEKRTLAVALLVLVAATALGLSGMLIGDYQLSVAQVVRALFGLEPDPLANYFVGDIRLPRVLAALLVGAALGVSGGIFQNISNNALGSPDIIGFTTGAATGALTQIVLFEAAPTEVAIGALVGGFGTAFLVYLLAWRGGLGGYRLVLVGIGISAVLSAINSLLVVRSSLVAAQTAAQWLAGSLNATTWGEVELLALALAVLLPAALLLARPLDMMVMGDDVASSLGVRVERTRALMVAIGIALVSVATAITGPIAFVALAAPQIAKKLSRSSRIGIGSAALMGAALVCAADLVAQRLFAPTELPVGVVTGSLGGIYLVWLLANESRRKAV